MKKVLSTIARRKEQVSGEREEMELGSKRTAGVDRGGGSAGVGGNSSVERVRGGHLALGSLDGEVGAIGAFRSST